MHLVTIHAGECGSGENVEVAKWMLETRGLNRGSVQSQPEVVAGS